MESYFDRHPFPSTPIDRSVTRDPNSGYWYDAQTPFIHRDGVLRGRTPARILDVGCGTGVKTVLIALQNPQAIVVGSDPSARSLEIARLRAKRHGARNVMFVLAGLPNTAVSEGAFDLVYCDEVLYLLENVVEALASVTAVLSDDGILVCSFHNYRQRMWHLSAQALSRYLKLSELEDAQAVANVRKLFAAMHPQLEIRRRAWGRVFETSSEAVFSNQLLINDRGFTLEQVLDLFAACELSHCGMMDEHEWRLTSYFARPHLVGDILDGVAWGTALYYKLIDALGYRGRLYRLIGTRRAVDVGGRVIGRTDLTESQLRNRLVSSKALRIHPAVGVDFLETRLHDADEVGILYPGSVLALFRNLPPLDRHSIGILIQLLKGEIAYESLIARWNRMQNMSPWTSHSKTAENNETALLRALLPLVTAGIVVLVASVE